METKKIPPSRGRPPGAKNKLGRTARENVVAVFNRLGGTTGMAEWARENLTEFYRLYARLIPIEGAVSVDFNHSLVHILAGMPRSDYKAVGATKPLLLKRTATDAEALSDAEEIAVLNRPKP